MKYLLHRVFNVGSFFPTLNMPQELEPDLVDAILHEVARMAEEVLAPLNQSGDSSGCRFESGRVLTPEGFKQAYDSFADGGWCGFTGAPDYGGQGMPKLLSVCLEEMLFAANSSFALYPLLTSGAALAIQAHGNPSLQASYLGSLYSGKFTGTMCLTEPQSGSDLGLLKTRAIPRQDDTYSIEGTKIFITGGEHDLTENIIHLVLARLPDSPAGVKGISMFLVPRQLLNENGTSGANNQVKCGSIEQKMGIKASATCVMNFEGSIGYLVGEPNQGLACMFTMMNYERLTMGSQGIGLSQYAYQVARDYALERRQGRSPIIDNSGSEDASLLADHPDIRRMLLTLRGNLMAGRALTFYTAMKLDVCKFSDDRDAIESATVLVDLLTPVVKAYCTDRGFEDCVSAQQVLGGYGYIKDWGLEQCVRDARIAQIYEGTNGIQALDLLGRKVVRNQGSSIRILVTEIEEFAARCKSHESLYRKASVLKRSTDELMSLTQHLVKLARSEPAAVGVAAVSYLNLLGTVTYGYMWLQILANANFDEEQINGENYLEGIRTAGEYYFDRMLSQVRFWTDTALAGLGPLLAMKSNQL